MAIQSTDTLRFINLVVQQFDQRYFSGTNSIPLPEDFKNTEPSQRGYLDLLPKDIQNHIYNFAPNFSGWLNSTRFIAAPVANPGVESVRKAAIELSAKELLVRLNQPLGYIKPYSEQLLTFVFQEAFNRAENDGRADVREGIIDLAKPVQRRLDNLPLTLRKVKYKSEAFFDEVLSNFWAKVALTYVGYRVSQWLQPQVYRLFSQTLIPKGMNYLINHAHPFVIRAVSGEVALVQFAYSHYWKATLTFWAAKWVSAAIHPQLKSLVTVVETAAFFPGKAIGYLVRSPLSLFISSWSMQASLAANLKASKDRDRAQYYEEGGVKAYRIWMELMQGGLQTTVSPAQA